MNEKELRLCIKSIALERKALLNEQRIYRRELNQIKEAKKK